jgi:hypothetical protein
MILFRFKCQQCDTVVEMTRKQSRVPEALRCPECAKAGVTSLLLPTCRADSAAPGESPHPFGSEELTRPSSTLGAHARFPG